MTLLQLRRRLGRTLKELESARDHRATWPELRALEIAASRAEVELVKMLQS